LDTKLEERRPSIRINTEVKGEPAAWLLDWKRRGLVLSNTDAIVQAFRVLHEKIVESDLKTNRLEDRGAWEGF